MGDTDRGDSLEAPSYKDIGLDLWICLFIGFYSEELLLVPVFTGSMFHMNHSFASENHGLGAVCQRRVLEFFIPAEIPVLDIFMERDVWFQQLQNQINIYKSNKTPQQKNSKWNSRAICPRQGSLWQQETWWGAVDHSGTVSHTQHWQSTKDQKIGYSVW